MVPFNFLSSPRRFDYWASVKDPLSNWEKNLALFIMLFIKHRHSDVEITLHLSSLTGYSGEQHKIIVWQLSANERRVGGKQS